MLRLLASKKAKGENVLTFVEFHFSDFNELRAETLPRWRRENVGELLQIDKLIHFPFHYKKKRLLNYCTAHLSSISGMTSYTTSEEKGKFFTWTRWMKKKVHAIMKRKHLLVFYSFWLFAFIYLFLLLFFFFLSF